MREAGNIHFRSRLNVCIFAACLILSLRPVPLEAGQVTLTIPINDTITTIETGLQPFAFGSDSVYCDGRLLSGDEYTINAQNGRLNLIGELACDTISVTVFKLPAWLVASLGNTPPPGRRLLDIESDMVDSLRPSGQSPQKISLSGNKSFSFTVGRSGEGRFSQGLNVDFDARVADDLRLRGSVSDRSGAENQFLSGDGGTMILSELDKYFFEIDGRRFLARGGDIASAENKYLPTKRLKGIYGAYNGDVASLSADLGRPAGRFLSQKISGVDGRQGPYQVFDANGAPTGIVPGSEKIYLDGQLLEGGSDRHYVVDYPSGRITFSPRVLITARSRIEIDFEAGINDYEQVVYDAAGEVRMWNGKVKFSFGGRRETDDKDKLRFGSISETEINILQQAGDQTDLAFIDGAVADTAGAYQLIVDSTGNEYFQYAGSDAGDYTVSFSYVGETKGDYRYLGDGVYEYAGQNGGDYLPIRHLPLPIRNDFFFSALEVKPYTGGVWRLEYQGNDRDNNLYSTIDDGDNFRGRIDGYAAHQAGGFTSRLNVRYRQKGFDPVYRLDPADDTRLWALPASEMTGDELRLYFDNEWKTASNRMNAAAGYHNYKGRLRSRLYKFSGQWLEDKRLTPRLEYQAANSTRTWMINGYGLYEKYGGGLSLKAFNPVRVDLGAERELTINRYGAAPQVEEYRQYQGAVFVRHSALTISRRIEYTGEVLGYQGPQQDKIVLNAEETFGRLQMTLGGTWFNQKKLDSQRDDRTERLYVTAFRYAPSSAWITVQAEYRQNRQSIRSTGYRYLQVNSGEGDYRLEDGQYLYDPDGDYIRILEERGGTTSVSVGEKNHNITFYPGRWPSFKKYKNILSQFAFRLRTEISEEMPGGDRRVISWVLPWTSRSGIEYIRRLRRERYSWLMFPAFNFYILNFTYANGFEEQDSGGTLYRHEKEYDTEFKNRLSPVVLSRLEWKRLRHDEAGAGTIALKLRNDEFTAGLVINPRRLQITPEVTYLRFTDKRSGGQGRGVVVKVESIWRQLNRGEIRLTTEIRSLVEKIAFSQPEYLVTDGRRFGRSAQFGLVVNYEIGRAWRLTVNLTDKVYENRPAEFVGRGELIARF